MAGCGCGKTTPKTTTTPKTSPKTTTTPKTGGK